MNKDNYEYIIEMLLKEIKRLELSLEIKEDQLKVLYEELAEKSASGDS